MVIDDEPWVRQLAGRILRDAGYDVLEAGSAQEALTRLQTAGDVRLVLADVAMPIMDGIQLANTLHKFYPDQRVILISAYAGVLAKIGIQGSPFPLLAKPFTAAQLTQKVQEVLGQG